jgi:hypothetical protein
MTQAKIEATTRSLGAFRAHATRVTNALKRAKGDVKKQLLVKKAGLAKNVNKLAAQIS